MARRKGQGIRVSDEEREAILAMLKEGKSVGQVAKRFGRSKTTVSKIGREAGLDLARPELKKAAEAQRAENAARRAELARLLLEDAFRLREQLWQPCRVYNFGGKDNVYREHILPEPDARTKREILTAIGIAVDKVIALEKHDNPEADYSEVDRWLDEMTGGDSDGAA
mgnify:FL=1